MREIFKQIALLLRSQTPLFIAFRLIYDLATRRPLSAQERQSEQEFVAGTKSLRVSAKWFLNHVENWIRIFDALGLSRAKVDLKGLEIGSWEGLSSIFIVGKFENMHLTCVDTWQGADEHIGQGINMREVEDNFDFNTSGYKDRITKFKGTSFQFFAQAPVREDLDFVYVDGSHYSDDVLIDAIKSFERLKVGGGMIFDDYLWNYYGNSSSNPCLAINLFLRLKKGQFKIVDAGYQLAIQKTRGNRRD